MALVETTLASPVAASDVIVNVASATGITAGRILRIGQEEMKASHGYSNSIDGTAVPVMRGWDGTKAPVIAHPTSARVVHGDPADFGAKGPAQASLYPMAGRPRTVVEYSTTGTMALPAPGTDMVVVLNSTAFTLTVPVPTLDLDGAIVYFVGSQGAAYVLEFTGGLGGASTSYETVTANGTGKIVFMVLAMNETWNPLVATNWSSGTSTNISATIG